MQSIFKVYLGEDYKIIRDLLYKTGYNYNHRPYQFAAPFIFIGTIEKIANSETNLKAFLESDAKEISSKELLDILEEQLHAVLYYKLCDKRVFLKNKRKQVLEILSNIGCRIDKEVYKEDTLFIRIDKNRYVHKVNTADEYYTLEGEEVQIDTILYYSK